MGVQISGDTGNVLATKGTYTGNLTVGGVLTYEDVTNVDSVGLVTARSGIEIGARPGVAASISVDGNMVVSGISTFGGDVNITNNLPQIYLTDSNSSNARARINANGGNLLLGADNDNAAADSIIYFEVDGSEKVRIDTSGRVLIGTTTEGEGDADDLTIATSGNTGITLRSGTSNDGAIFFSDGTSGTDEYKGTIQYLHSSDAFIFKTSASERLRIDSSGRLLINKSSDRGAYYGGTFSGYLQVEGTGNLSRLTQFIHNTNTAAQHILVIGKSRGTSAGSYTVVQNSDYLGTLSFQGADGDAMIEGARIDAIVTGDPGDQDMPTALTFGTTADGASSTTERARIDSSGRLLVGTTTQAGKLTVDSGTSNTCATFQSSDAGAVINIKDSAARSSIEQNDTALKIIADTDDSDGDSKIQFQVDASTKLELNDNGNLFLRSASANYLVMGSSGDATSGGVTNNMNWIRGNGTNTQLNCAGGFMSFEISGTEIGRFSSDDFLVGTTSNSSSNGVGLKLNYGSTNPTFNCVINQSAGNHSFYHLYNTNATHNAYRFYVMTNGGIANHSGNNSNLSDERMKKNITDMGSVYDTFKGFKFKDFNYLDDEASESKKHGLIAQEVETIDSDLITEDFKIAPDSEGNDVYRKALKEEQFMMIGMKALQEAIAKIDTLEAEVAALKGS